MASSSARNQRMPASPASWDHSHSRIASASRSACAVVLTRNAMLLAEFGEEFGCGPGTTGLHIFVAQANSFHGFLKVQTLPFQKSGQCVVEGCSWVLATSAGVFLKLGFTLRLQRDGFHNNSMVARICAVNL